MQTTFSTDGVRAVAPPGARVFALTRLFVPRHKCIQTRTPGRPGERVRQCRVLSRVWIDPANLVYSYTPDAGQVGKAMHAPELFIVRTRQLYTHIYMQYWVLSY